jgi:hypothetical protein
MFKKKKKIMNTKKFARLLNTDTHTVAIYNKKLTHKFFLARENILKTLFACESIWKHCLVMKYLETLLGHKIIWKACLVMKIFGNPAWT